MRPDDKNLAPRISARRMPWVSLPDMGKPNRLIEPVPSHCLMVLILSFMISL